MNRFLRRGQSLIESDYNSKNDRKIVFFVLLVVFAAILLLNYLQPIFNDDWVYSFKIEEGFSEKKNPPAIKSFSDFVSSQTTHYQIWGGRTVAHIIVQALLIMDTPFRVLLNSMAFVLLVWAICRLSSPTNRKGVLLATTALMLWFLQPGFAASVLWITGSGNYLWTTAIILLFLYPFTKSYLENNYKKKNLFCSFLFLPAGIVAGWTNENIAVALSFFALLYLVYLGQQKIRIPSWIILGIVGFFIGMLFLILAPGNKVRLESEYIHNGVNGSGYIVSLLRGFKAVLVSCFFNGLPTILLYVLMLVAYRFYRKDDAEHRKLILSAFFFFVALLALFAMSASPTFPPRAWFGVITFMVVAIAILYTTIDFGKYLPLRIYHNVLLLFFIVLFIGQYSLAAKDLKQIKSVFAERTQIVKEEKQKGNLNVVFHSHLKLETDFPHTKDLDVLPTDWKNELYSIYYGLDSVRVAPQGERADNKKE